MNVNYVLFLENIMQIEITLNEGLVRELLDFYKSDDLNSVINNILKETITKKNHKIEDFFGKVDYYDDYDYKSMRNRNEGLS